MAKTIRVKRQPETLTTQIKRLIDASGLSIYKLAKESGIPQPVLQRFVSGERDIKLSTADKLAVYFRLTLR
jgi:plasmid maintenance system antidote protein VapI